MTLAQELAQRVAQGMRKIGQVLISPTPDGYELRHVEDLGRDGLKLHLGPARLIALYDDQGRYRPLKTAPNLAHGWKLLAASPEALLHTLDALYPAQCGMHRSLENGALRPVDLRDTLSRQTGMYRITKLLRNDQAQKLIADTCTSHGGCLRRILWRIEPEEPVRSLPADKFDATACAKDELPLLCAEACNLLVAAARPVAKKNLPS